MSKGAFVPTGYLEQSKDPLNSLVLCLPILLVYEAGLMLSRGRTLNGVDFVTLFFVRRWGIDGLLAFNAGVLITCLIAVMKLRRERRMEPKIVVPLVLESTAYALLMGSLIVLVMERVGLDTSGSVASLSVADRVFLSLGAGFHEELLFRMVLFAAPAALLCKLMPNHEGAAWAIALLGSSILFSLAHYMGAEAFEMRTFVYRFLAGALLCGLYVKRGFAVAVYTHTIYDIWVLVLRQ